MTLSIVALVMVVCMAFAFLAFWVWINWSVYKDVRGAPRIKMFTCDRHGPFPESSCLTYTVPKTKPTDEELTLQQCPFCFGERMDKSQKLFK